MAKTRILVKRGTAELNNLYIGYRGEITIDETNKTIRLHDGITPGGSPVRDISSLTQSQIESVIATYILNHSFSGDHDGRYYQKSEVDSLFDNYQFIFDSQNTLLKVDNLDYGWKTLSAAIDLRAYGNFNLKTSTFRDGLKAYTFENGTVTGSSANFLIPQGYQIGTAIYPFVSWSINTTAGGNVRWGFEYAIGKGFNQGTDSDIGPSSLLYTTETFSANNRYRHFISILSGSGITSNKLEPNSLIVMRIFRDANNDTYGSAVFGFKVGISFQFSRLGTKNRLPDYYI